MENATNKNTLSDLLGSSSSSIESSGNGEKSIFSSWEAWLMIVLVLAFIGFSIYTYLAKDTGSISQYIANLFGSGSTSTPGPSPPDSSTPIPNQSTPTPTPTPNQSQSANLSPSSQMQQQEQEQYNIADTTLNRALNNASANTEQQYSADDSYSSIQQTKSSNKSGWCFIGEDRGFRSCIEVGEADTCMTGDIFPTHEICVNPTLRQ